VAQLNTDFTDLHRFLCLCSKDWAGCHEDAKAQSFFLKGW